MSLPKVSCTTFCGAHTSFQTMLETEFPAAILIEPQWAQPARLSDPNRIHR